MPPKGGDAALETYIRKFRADVQQQLEANQLKRCTDNLTSNERIALRKLRQRRDVVIKPADKGSAVVVLSKEDYINEAERQLNDHAHYTKLNADPTLRFAVEIKSFIHSMFTNGQIDKNTRDFLIPHHSRAARLYLLPKIHKPGNPGRPIVSSNSAPTENISRFVDWFLQPFTTVLPSYIRDTTDFINRLRRLPLLPPGTLLVTLDVSSLYTNIPHEEGITACEKFLNLRDHLVPSTADLCHLIRLILTMNSFSFNGNYYLQIHGTAMGTRMAPSFANLFMGKLEREFLLTQDVKPREWWRFIDDIFAIWTHGESLLRHFIESLNRHHPTIKFTANWSAQAVTFLDTTVYLENGRIRTDLHVKPTDKHQYLRMDSCHPIHCKASIPYSQALRLRRICSEEQVFKNRARELKQHFLSRGYNEQHLNKQIQRALNTSREACLQPKQNREKSARIPLVVTYHPILPFFRMTAKRHLPILHVSERLRRAFRYPPIIAFRRPKNLKDFLVRATLTSTPSEPPGNYPCGAP